MTDKHLEGQVGGVPFSGRITGGAIKFSAVPENSPEHKFARRLEDALDSLSFSTFTLAIIIVNRFPPIIQQKVWDLVRHLVGEYAELWDKEAYDNEQAEIARDAGIMRDALITQERWEEE